MGESPIFTREQNLVIGGGSSWMALPSRDHNPRSGTVRRSFFRGTSTGRCRCAKSAGRIARRIQSRHLGSTPDHTTSRLTSRGQHATFADICRHTPELSHIQPQQILFGFAQARNSRAHGLQARVTPLRFQGGHLVKQARGRLFQVQRFMVHGEEMLYLMTFCLPRFFYQDFDEKFVTIFHELFHIGPHFDGDLRRHRGRYCMHTHSKANYDAQMAQHARAYLNAGANPKLHGFLRLSFAQLRARHGRIVGHVPPRAKILPVPLDDSQLLDRAASRRS